MKQINVLLLIIVLGMMLTGCQGQASHEKAENLLFEGEYEEAIEVYQMLIEEEGFDYNAWLGLADAFLATENYSGGEDALKGLMALLEVDYAQDPGPAKNFIKEVVERVSVIIDKTGDIGEWYRKLQPEAISLEGYEFAELTMEDVITIDVPEGSLVFYNFDGDAVKGTDIRYHRSVEFIEPGEYTLTMAAINDMGIISDESAAFITVIDEHAGIQAPRVNLESGVYGGPIVVRFNGYTQGSQDVYYVLDGSDAEFGYYYAAVNGVVLYAGEYELSAVVYDWELDAFSAPVNISLSVTGNTIEEAPDDHILHVGIIDRDAEITDELSWAVEGFGIQTGIEVELQIFSSISELIDEFNRGIGPDVVYGWSVDTINLYNFIGDVNYIADITEDYTYYPSVVDSAYYWDAHYVMPVVVKPMAITYYNYANLVGYYNDGMTYEAFIDEMDLEEATRGLILPSSVESSSFLAIYDGFGGEIHNTLGYVSLDYQAVVETLEYYRFLADNNYLNQDADFVTWDDAKYYGDADFIAADTSEYNGEEFSNNYEPLGGIPLPNGDTAFYPTVVGGLFVNYAITNDFENPKRETVKDLYEFLAMETDYNGYIANAADALPAISGQLNEIDYSAVTDIYYYESIIQQAPEYSIDLAQILWLIDFEETIYDLIIGDISPEACAALLMDMIENSYVD